MNLTLLYYCFACFGLGAGIYIETTDKYVCPKSDKVIHPCKCISASDQGLSIVCRNSNLAVLSVGLSNVVSLNSAIVNVTLTKCNISRLYGDLLYAVNTAKLIVDDVPLTDIEQDVFLGIGKRLKELILRATNLSSLEFGRRLSNISALTIDRHKIVALTSTVLDGIDAARSTLDRLSIANGGPIAAIEPNSFENFRRLKFLSLRNNSIAELKRNQFKGLTELESIDVSGNSIAKLDASHFGDLVKLTHCNLSRNHLSSLPRGTFARNTLLRVLDLSGNRLTRLDVNALRGLLWLNRLYLNDNEITNVDRATFGSVSRVRTINLARNKLDRVDYQMFNDMRLIEKIDLSGNAISTVEKTAFKSLYLVDIDLSRNNISVIQSGAFEQCVNVTRLDLSGNRLARLNKDAFDEYSYALELQLSGNELEDLSQVPLANMTGLKILNVTYNRLKVIPRNTFPTKLYELHTVDLSHNALEKLAPEVFQPLLGLRWLNLSDNSLTELTQRHFGKLPTLLELRLQRNRIATVKADAFVHLTSLRTLDLSGNEIGQLFQVPMSLSELNVSDNRIDYIAPHKVWPSMNSLIALDLSRNLVGDSLEKGAFANLLVLQGLDLSFNEIATVPKDSLSDFTSLRHLNLRANHITELAHSAFGSLQILFTLNLADNRIENLADGAFKHLPQLRLLNLSGNNISALTGSEVFADLYTLEELDISGNFLDALDNKTNSVFEQCFSLKTLNASYNRVASLNRNSFPSRASASLSVVDLTGNRLSILTADSVRGLKRSRHLNFSRNAIEDVTKNLFENFTSLRSLDLSGNLLRSLGHDALPANLSYLRVSDNAIRQLQFRNWTSIVRLEVFDVRNNSLATFYDQLNDAIVKHDVQVLYAGNPVLCDCSLRPLRRWLVKKLGRRDDSADDANDLLAAWANFTCYDFRYDITRRLMQVDQEEQQLWCDSITLRSFGARYDAAPDVEFRSAQSLPNGMALISWFVTQPDEDVADFFLEIKMPSSSRNFSSSVDSATLYNKSLPYSTRTEYVNKRVVPSYATAVDACIIAKTSLSIFRGKRQCERIQLNGADRSSVYGCLLFLAVSINIAYHLQISL